MPTIHTALKKQLITGGLVLLLVASGSFILLPQLGSFHSSMQSLQTANVGLSLLALLVALLACVFSGLLYVVLAKRSLNIINTVLVQLSGLLVNRVLPAGIGGLGLNVWYLRKSKLSVAQSSVTVALNNTLGFVGHLLLIVAFIIPFSTQAKGMHRTNYVSAKTLLAVVIIGAVLLLAGYIARHRIGGFLQQIGRELRRLVDRFKNRPDQLLLCIALSCALTLCNVLSFWLCCDALQLPVSFAVAFFIYSFSVLLGTATPTPGGLGGVEAALIAGLVSQGVSAPLALAATLLYRLVSYWIGLVVGLLAGLTLRLRLAV